MGYTVYLRTNKVNGKQYVGQTKDLNKREREWKCLKGKYGSKFLTEERDKYGLENFETKILAETDTREEAWVLEEKYIKELGTKYPNGYNKANGGRLPTGYSHSEEQRKKWSEIRKGKHISPKTEFKKGLVHWIKGKHHSEETNEKNRQAHLGKISKKRKPVIQLSLDGEFIAEYTYSGEAAKVMGFKSDESIRKACVANWRTSGGYKWMYKEDYEKMLAEQGC